MATRSAACIRCAKAKRRCGKQWPRCSRCHGQALACAYPAPKPTAFVLVGDETGDGKDGAAPMSPDPKASGRAPADSAMALDPWCAFVDRQPPAWFTGPDTWEVDHFVPAARPPPCAADLRFVQARIDAWLAAWVATGSNPFIHRQLYHARLPPAIQDAYTALASYRQRTAANEGMVFRIVEDRSRRLVERYTHDTKAGGAADPLEHLARVQALLVYQHIGLFDGDIRLRHLAESHVATLHRWMDAMIGAARRAPCLGAFLRSAAAPTHPPDDWENTFWHAWILAESIRRTWLMASGVQGVYANLQRPDAALSCKGGMKFTARRDVWEAESAMEWEQLCLRVNVGLIHIGEADTLSTRVALDDISEFATIILRSTWGSEKMRRWGIRVDG